jgi:glycosyltransferase involved in cell wall biosynthesis
MLGIPYLNFFSNLKLCDTALPWLHRTDVVYERNGLYRNGVAMACRRAGTPYILFVDADEIVEHDYMGVSLKGLLRKRAEQLFQYNLNTASQIVCVSDAACRNLVKRWRVAPERIVVFPNRADVQRFRPDASARRAIRETLSLGDRPIVLFVGSFYKWHDVATLLRAFVLLLRVRPEAALVLVGDGETRRNMSQLAADLGISDSVYFIGNIPHHEVPLFIAAADVSVAPYAAGGPEMWMSPLKVYESMAGGAAVVASAVGQLTQVIDHGETGLLTRPGDPVDLSRAIGRLLSDKACRERLTKAARQQAVSAYSWDRYAADLEQLCHVAVAAAKAASHGGSADCPNGPKHQEP